MEPQVVLLGSTLPLAARCVSRRRRTAPAMQRHLSLRVSSGWTKAPWTSRNGPSGTLPAGRMARRTAAQIRRLKTASRGGILVRAGTTQTVMARNRPSAGSRAKATSDTLHKKEKKETKKSSGWCSTRDWTWSGRLCSCVTCESKTTRRLAVVERTSGPPFHLQIPRWSLSTSRSRATASEASVQVSSSQKTRRQRSEPRRF